MLRSHLPAFIGRCHVAQQTHVALSVGCARLPRRSPNPLPTQLKPPSFLVMVGAAVGCVSGLVGWQADWLAGWLHIPGVSWTRMMMACVCCCCCCCLFCGVLLQPVSWAGFAALVIGGAGAVGYFQYVREREKKKGASSRAGIVSCRAACLYRGVADHHFC